MPSRHYRIPNALLAPRLTSPSTPSQLEHPFLPKPQSFEMKCFIFNGIDWGDIGSKACRFQMYHSTPSSGTASYASAQAKSLRSSFPQSAHLPLIPFLRSDFIASPDEKAGLKTVS